MIRSSAAFAIFLGLTVSELLTERSTAACLETSNETGGNRWDFTLEIATYLAQHSRDYANPTLYADYDHLHVEARYNYEALKTGSVWLGYNFEHVFELKKNELNLEAAPMIGGVFGDITGAAPGYTITATYNAFEFETIGEYFFDAAKQTNDFFYSWSELSVKPLSWWRPDNTFKLGLVIDRTKAFGSDFEVRRGPLVGFAYCGVDLTVYWLSPGSRQATFVFSVTHEF
jgi:hypothetical protein